MAKTTRTPDEQIARLKAEVKRLNERLGAEIRTNDENSAMLRAERQNTLDPLDTRYRQPFYDARRHLAVFPNATGTWIDGEREAMGRMSADEKTAILRELYPYLVSNATTCRP